MIAIIAAMDAEINEIIKFTEVTHTKEIASIKLFFGKIGNKDVVLCKSGVGKAMASMATTVVCMETKPIGIINIGTAGGLTQDENPLDIVISDKVVQADFDTSPLDGPEGLGLVFESDEHARLACIESAKRCKLTYHVGTIATQDLFMSREEDYAKLLNNFPNAICSEMEAGAVAQVATAFKVPYVIVRSLSDIVHKEENHLDFMEYVSIASHNCSMLVKDWIETL